MFRSELLKKAILNAMICHYLKKRPLYQVLSKYKRQKRQSKKLQILNHWVRRADTPLRKLKAVQNLNQTCNSKDLKDAFAGWLHEASYLAHL